MKYVVYAFFGLLVFLGLFSSAMYCGINHHFFEEKDNQWAQEPIVKQDPKKQEGSFRQIAKAAKALRKQNCLEMLGEHLKECYSGLYSNKGPGCGGICPPCVEKQSVAELYTQYSPATYCTQ